jgi:1,4-alpha-glucan branching enzyme
MNGNGKPPRLALYVTGFHADGFRIDAAGALRLEASGGYVLHRDAHGATVRITCLACGATSSNRTDIAERYCGRCHVFHEELHQEHTR